ADRKKITGAEYHKTWASISTSGVNCFQPYGTILISTPRRGVWSKSGGFLTRELQFIHSRPFGKQPFHHSRYLVIGFTTFEPFKVSLEVVNEHGWNRGQIHFL